MEGSPGATHRLHICFQCFVRAGSLEVKTFSKCPEEELGPGSHAPKGHGNPRPRWSPGVTRKCVWFSPWSSPNPGGKAPQAGAALGGAGLEQWRGQAWEDSEASRHSATPHRPGEGATSEIRGQCWRASEPRERAAVSTRAWGAGQGPRGGSKITRVAGSERGPAKLGSGQPWSCGRATCRLATLTLAA